MEDSLAVRVANAVERLPQEWERAPGTHRSALFEEFFEGVAFDVLHDHQVVVAFAVEAVHGGDIGVGEPGHRVGLAAEALRDVATPGEPRMQHLDGDLSVEHQVEAEIHLATTALADLFLDSAVAECFSDPVRRQQALLGPAGGLRRLSGILFGIRKASP